MFEAAVDGVVRLTGRVTDRLHDGRLERSMAAIVLGVLAVSLVAFLTGGYVPGLRALTPVAPAAFVGWAAACAAVIALFVVHRNRVQALITVAIVGLIMAAAFVHLSAPDLALTQIAVEVVTVVLMLLALMFLPRETPRDIVGPRLWRNGVIAGGAGLSVGALAYALMTRDSAFAPVSGWHLANAKTEGGGTNAVNVIIVDFRGFDTFGEIIVLGIAALLMFALTEALLRPGPANDRLLHWRADVHPAGDRHPLILAVAARLLLPVAAIVGVYVFLRGHNQPGGGFVAGLIVAIALLVQYMAAGFGWAHARVRVDYHALVGAGILIAGVTGLGAWFNDLPFLTSAFGYFTLGPISKFELTTAALFDLGVFLTVLGAVMLALASLSRLSVRAGETVNERPFDIDPSAAVR